jgi:hypothetical protein
LTFVHPTECTLVETGRKKKVDPGPPAADKQRRRPAADETHDLLRPGGYLLRPSRTYCDLTPGYCGLAGLINTG